MVGMVGMVVKRRWCCSGSWS